jgi:ethanolaminephosphotransferase
MTTIVTSHSEQQRAVVGGGKSLATNTLTEQVETKLSEDECHATDSLLYFFSDRKVRNGLRQYQYSGQDLSLLYHYILSPLASFCVTYGTPRTVAPNVITMVGLLFMIAAYSVMWYHVPMLFTGPSHSVASSHSDTTNISNDDMSTTNDVLLPRYIFLCNAIAILVYQTLDNMDGKQARRINASSPLGLFFDHGCDAINSVFGSANWIVAFGLSHDDSILAFIMLLGPYALFYCSTWEEYYTGQLILPIMNGPNEGLLGAVVVSLVSFWYGPSYWHQYDWWETLSLDSILQYALGFETVATIKPLRNCDLFIFLTAICMAQEIAQKMLFIVRGYGLRTLYTLLPLITLAVCTLLLSSVNYNIWIHMPRTCLHLSSILFVEATTDLMLKHMTKQKYQPFRLILLPLIIFTTLIMTSHWPHLYLSADQFLLIYTSIAGTYLVIKSTILIHEMCIILNIWCFTIGKRRIKGAEHVLTAPNSFGNKND